MREKPRYYRLELDDYSAAAFTSFGKYYYGTTEDFRCFFRELTISQPRIKNDGLCFDITDEIVVDVNIAFLVIVHGIAFADLNFLNQANQRGTV